MFIELADHLRCPAEHVEAYLVLLPGRVEDRSVVSGHLGCPICGWGVGFEGGAVDFGGGRPATGETRWTAPAVQALLGISGPGGYVALVGTAAGLAPTLAPLLPGVRLVAVNPPADLSPDAPASVLRGGRMPLKRACLRGAVLGEEACADRVWLRDALASVLPGLRILGEGEPPEMAGLEVLASAAGTWLGLVKKAKPV